jgi:hypothetical protein
MTDQANALDPATKLAVHEYLVTKLQNWGKWFGLANGAALLVGAAYIFYVLPQQAADTATSRLSQSFKQQIDQILEARTKAETARSDAENAAATIREAKELVQGINRQDMQTLKQLGELIRRDPNVSAISAISTDLAELKKDISANSTIIMQLRKDVESVNSPQFRNQFGK